MNALALIIANDNPVIVRKPRVQIVPATKAHIQELIKTLREDDRREIEDHGGFTCAKGLWRSYRRGFMNQTAMVDGEVAAIWGVGGELLSDIGQPWLLTSHAIEKVSPLRFAKTYAREVRRMLAMFPVLINYVAADYEKAIRLLRIAGFEISAPERFGNGMYRKFEKRA